ncbi:hypothetical protein VSH64_34745 [Amycolatopsis rhabdoformis]|uniref:DUF3558 domain-containing protein n=1 Tax=Amycolatopsis rhabdoformis TaxID=1448059 RepID=A0ABZ1I0R4_9PSEU|nr:hypothetical protein [Amycolatopsis rhabdoformis]WSE27976.1 hypothetical protein VSH64_34745 [Amycolatopsis rhabdoformis]
MNPQVPPGAAPYYGGPSGPSRRGRSAGWIVAIVVVGVVVAGAAVGAFVVLNRSGGEADGKYGAAPLPTCDQVGRRVAGLPPKVSDKKLEGSQGWLCTFADSASSSSVHLDLAVSTVAAEHAGFDTVTSSGGYVLDPDVRLGEKAAWGFAPTGQMCELIVLDSNATFKVGLDNWTAPTDDAQSCESRVKTIARAVYNVVQPQ